MLYLISKDNVPDYKGSEGEIIYLVSSIKQVIQHNLNFVFSDGHGIMDFTSFYDNLKYLDEIDWPLMKAQYWNDTEEEQVIAGFHNWSERKKTVFKAGHIRKAVQRLKNEGWVNLFDKNHQYA